MANDVLPSPFRISRSQATVTAWPALNDLALYRLIVAALFAMLGLLDVAPHPLGYHQPGLFTVVCFAYLLFSLAAGLASRARQPGFERYLLVVTIIDIVALSAMMFASGGVCSGFGMLLVVAVAGGSILSRRRIALVFASFASMAVMMQQMALSAEQWVPITDYTHGGFLGLGFFATAALAHFSANRIRPSEGLAAQHVVDLANLGQLNGHIIQHMQSGVVVVDVETRIRLMNTSASELLGADTVTPSAQLHAIAPRVDALLTLWRSATIDCSLYVAPSPATW